MGIFTLPPKLPHTDLDYDLFMRNPEGVPVRRLKRTLPAEWFPQSAVQLTWPHTATDWNYMLNEITETYVRLAYEIAIREKLLIVTPEPEAVEQLLKERLPQRATKHIVYVACPTNDTWARDHGFITVVGTGGNELLDFSFNGWGGKFESSLDNAINRHIFDAGIATGTYVDCLDIVLEGGSIESDGMGTLLTTACCLNAPGRNGEDCHIESELMERLGVERILWLHHGHLEGDDTDGHIDTLARLCPYNQIAYVKCDDPSDSTHFDELMAMERELKTFTTLSGDPYTLVPLPHPAPIYDSDGKRLPATYANFLITNSAIIYPTYRQPEFDEQARKALQKIFPKYDLVGIDATALIQQHGSIHCATMQFPKGVINTQQA